MISEVATNEFFTDFSAVGIAKKTVSDERGFLPNILWRVLPYDLNQKINRVHAGGSQFPLASPLFQNTKK